MSIALSAFITKLNNLIQDNITGTTDAAGNTDKTTLVDSDLKFYEDGTFGDPEGRPQWFVYLSATAELRRIEKSLSDSGTIMVYKAFASQVASSVAYELHKFDRAQKVIAANQALNDAYPYFYKPLYNTTLWGQNNYGVSPDEYNKFIYSVPATFTEYPDAIWLLESYIGDHTGDDAASILTDTNASFTINELIGRTVYNKTDGSKATVTANTATTVTGTLAGGTDNKWDEGDEYIVQKPNKKPIELREYVIPDVGQAGSLEFYADINEKYLIGLAGKTPLTQFTNDASTTELTDSQARIVCFKAAANLYRMLSGKVNAKDSGRFDSLANRYEVEFEQKKIRGGMPILTHLGLDWSWME